MKKDKSGFWGKIIITLCVIIAIFAGGYFFLDKLVIPKYFGQYGINSVPDLVGVVTSLYRSPRESSLITNGYTNVDLTNAIGKLQASGYKIADDGTIRPEDYNNFKGDKPVELSDKEFAAICNKMISDGMLVDALPNLNYLNVLNITLLQVVITPDEESYDGEGYTSANMSLIIKIDTTDVREQIAEQMQTPLFLLNMIIPDTLYFSVSYDFDLTATDSDRTNGSIAINGRSAEQSELLINLLIDFIFPKEDDMNIEKFTMAVGDVALKGIDALGNFKFMKDMGVNKENGFLINAK